MKLNVEFRNIVWKNVKKLRREDKVPAVVYSKHLEKPVSILCDRNEFVKLYRQTGYSTPITLIWEWIDELVLIQDIQLDPVRDQVVHIDFCESKMSESVSRGCYSYDLRRLISYSKILRCKFWGFKRLFVGKCFTKRFSKRNYCRCF